ncbi:hypothetical protein VE03_01420 [Pseudogymnoascus sp. 23342-1-I1]|nr:hypothetical protein VE03_01420 [Pseudogymnoascus sp. 23342-1-I1]
MDLDSETEESVELLSLYKQEPGEPTLGRHEASSGAHKAFQYTKSGFLLLCLILTSSTLWFALPSLLSQEDQPSYPYAQTINGTVYGVRDAFNQDLFLGIPYAKPPIGNLRFRQAETLSEGWQKIRFAVEYSPHCIGYGDRQEEFQQSEDCLTINIVRPAGHQRNLLPVGVYIYGGGTHGGGSSDPRYNLSMLVSHAADVGLPFIGVSFNYRSSIWGFISGKEVVGTGNSNIGLHDQRAALRWIQENIGAFGGDKNKVTIWGGSSGANSVGLHLTAYGGRDDGLFRAAIMQSGGPIVETSLRSYSAQEAYDEIAMSTGCLEANDSLQCLRDLSAVQLNTVFNNSAQATSKLMAAFSKPALDGDFMRRFGSLQIRESQYVKVPILSGVVSSEAATWIPKKISTWEDLFQFLTDDCRYPPSVIEKLLAFYPTLEPQQSSPLVPPIGSFSDKDTFDRVKAVIGDIELNAAQRYTCQAFSSSAKCFSFIFDAVPTWSVDPRVGVPHGAEIVPLFQNLNEFDLGEDEEGYRGMSKLMGTMWAGFITALDPNTGLNEHQKKWPLYSLENPENFIFNATGSGLGWSESDTYRSEALGYIAEILASVFGR